MLAASIAVALAFWGPAPCTLVYHVAALEPANVAGTEWRDGIYCQIRIDARRWRWGELCSVIVHETGHAHGLRHSSDPRDVMYPVLTRTADACRGKRPARYPPGTMISLR